MGVMLDLLFSVIFGGAVFVITLNVNQTATETLFTHSGDMLVQEMLISTAQLVEGELRNMGFGVPEDKASVIRADSSSIGFLCDLSRTGTTVDTVSYWVGGTNDAKGTKNELDRFLYRKVNGRPKRPVGIVTQFCLQYFTKGGERLQTPVPSDRLSEVHVVEVTIEVQSQDAPLRDENLVQSGERTKLYSSSLWQQTRLASQNTRR